MRRHIVHTLVGGEGQYGGFNALDYRKIRQGNAGKLGTYDILSVLPDKFARFLFEIHAHRFESLDPPFLPQDISNFDVHWAPLDDKVHNYVILWTLNVYCVYIIFLHIMSIMTIISIETIISLIINMRTVHNGKNICHKIVDFVL